MSGGAVSSVNVKVDRWNDCGTSGGWVDLYDSVTVRCQHVGDVYDQYGDSLWYYIDPAHGARGWVPSTAISVYGWSVATC
ncbi:hypothetical protein [Streptacidiphilus carbonis]|uniref:hypothetical protein n=1 Tax=Streptacidiphilus carbonis TaxID=105422 RepID=UPI001269DA01|nr:hypothetical protein [Streptacidiphilus carbonis]